MKIKNFILLIVTIFGTFILCNCSGSSTEDLYGGIWKIDHVKLGKLVMPMDKEEYCSFEAGKMKSWSGDINNSEKAFEYQYKIENGILEQFDDFRSFGRLKFFMEDKNTFCLELLEGEQKGSQICHKRVR